MISNSRVIDLHGVKALKVYSKAWEIKLPSGWTAWVDRLDVRRNYLGFLGGLPCHGQVNAEIESAKDFVRSTFHGPEPVVIPPKLYDAHSIWPVLPPLRFAAQIIAYEPLTKDDEGSWVNLIWFAEINDDKSIKAFVEEALKQVDWRASASGYNS